MRSKLQKYDFMKNNKAATNKSKTVNNKEGLGYSATIKLEGILERKGLLNKESIIKDIIENETVKQFGKIILAAAFISGIIVISAMAPNLFGALGKILKSNRRQKTNKVLRQKTMQTIYNLRRNKLIEWDRRGDKIMLKITPRGRSVFLKKRLYELKIKRQEKWDKIWRVVIFDIPNKLGARRDIFRQRLKKMGFWQFQKSAFLAPFPCRQELEVILAYYNLFEYVTYLEATKVSGEEKCRKYFDL